METYVKECIESVLSQKTKFKYEVIVINDGSLDNTLNILKEYEDRMEIVLVDQKIKDFQELEIQGYNMYKESI